MTRAEKRRNLKYGLATILAKKGTSWRRYRKYLVARRDISLIKRVKLVAHSFGE